MATEEEEGHALRARESYQARQLVPSAEEVEEAEAIRFQPSTPILGPGVTPLSGLVKLTSGFGSRTPPREGASRYHRAVDFGAMLGAPVLSMRSGRVIFAGEHGGHGNRVIIQFYDGTTVAYSHLRDVGVASGDRVVMGQRVGSVGSTGISTGPHLHIEAALPGKNVLRPRERGDPMEILPELSHAKRGAYNDFGEAPEEGASPEEIEMLSGKFRNLWRTWISEGKPEEGTLGDDLGEAYADLESIGIDPVDVASTVREYGPAAEAEVDLDEQALIRATGQ